MKTKKNEYTYKEDYLSDLDAHDNYIKEFDAWEAMLIGQVYDSVSKSISSSSITDSYSATLSIERAARVVGKLPDGVVEAIAKQDTGKAIFLDLLRQKWIYPNANAQRPFFEKLRLWQLYSSVYGYMPMFYDWNVSKSGYVGPDCWLWNPRNLVPQQGRVSLHDMDYVTALSWVGESTLEGWLEADEEAGWDKKEIKALLKLANKESSSSDDSRDTNTERSRTSSDTKKGILIATRYEAGPEGYWTSFAPDYGCKQLRSIPNPHKNSRIPFVIKYSQPLFDSFYGMGDFQRAKPLQFARDGLTNFYFHGIKMNLLPPIVANSNGIIKHTLDYRPGGVIMETIPNSVRRLETSTAGLNTYQAAQSQLTGALLSLYGTQNASIPGAEALNPSQGKTPAAINMYNGKEATKDGQERAQLEQAIGELTEGFFSLVANIGTEFIPINLLTEDIKSIVASGHKDILELVEENSDGESGTLVLDPEVLRGSEFRFNIRAGSTAEVNREQQKEQLLEFIGVMGKFQNILRDDPSVVIEWGKMFDRFESLTGIEGAGEFITIIPPEVLQAQAQAQAQMQAQAQAEATPPPQPINVAGTTFNNPEIAAVAQQVSSL